MTTSRLAKTLFLISVVASFAIRILNIGWFLIMFGAIIIAGRIAYILLGFRYWKRAVEANKKPVLLWVGSALILFTSLFAFDFGDVSSYMFFMQWQDPPEWLIIVYYSGMASCIVMGILFFLFSRKYRKLVMEK